MKSRGGKSQRRERQKKEDEKRKSQKKDAGAAKHCGFAMFCGSGGSKSTGAGPSGDMRDENLHAVVARSTLGSKTV